MRIIIFKNVCIPTLIFRKQICLYLSSILKGAFLRTALTHFMPLVSCYTPCKHLKTRSFLFSGGIEIEHCAKIG